MSAPSTEEVTERLRVLHDKLEAEGSYVGSNTCYLATEALKAVALERDQMAEFAQRSLDDCTVFRNEIDRLKYLLAEDDWA